MYPHFGIDVARRDDGERVHLLHRDAEDAGERVGAAPRVALHHRQEVRLDSSHQFPYLSITCRGYFIYLSPATHRNISGARRLYLNFGLVSIV